MGPQRGPHFFCAKINKRGYPERTSDIECGSLSNGNLDFPDKQVNKFVNVMKKFYKNY
jgi:hypothetical protein